jgi:hypothetical protein
MKTDFEIRKHQMDIADEVRADIISSVAVSEIRNNKYLMAAMGW